MPLKQAISSCESLGESLWAAKSGFKNIQHDLDYLVYQGKYPRSQHYWIAPIHNTPSTINADGRISRATPDTHLPVLCTQSAPYSTPYSKDTNSTWQVSVQSDNEYIG